MKIFLQPLSLIKIARFLGLLDFYFISVVFIYIKKSNIWVLHVQIIVWITSFICDRTYMHRGSVTLKLYCQILRGSVENPWSR
jgi:hypothetical protein